MASGVNDCTFIGNVGKDPELRYTPNGAAIARFSLGVNETWKQEGEKKESNSKS